MEQLLDIAVKLLAAVLSLVATWAVAKLRAYIKSKMSAEDAAKLDAMIIEFVTAAEQQLKESDPTGEKRKAYVETLLIQAGYKITDILTAKVESAVFIVNQEQK